MNALYVYLPYARISLARIGAQLESTQFGKQHVFRSRRRVEYLQVIMQLLLDKLLRAKIPIVGRSSTCPTTCAPSQPDRHDGARWGHAAL